MALAAGQNFPGEYVAAAWKQYQRFRNSRGWTNQCHGHHDISAKIRIFIGESDQPLLITQGSEIRFSGPGGDWGVYNSLNKGIRLSF